MKRLWQVLRHACGLDERRCVACLCPFISAPDCLPNTRSSLLCPDCLAAFSVHATLCMLCGQPLPQTAPSPPICGACHVHAPPWQRLHVLGAHQGLVRTLLLRAKFGGDMVLCRALGSMLVEQILGNGGTSATLLVPMPLHPTRLRQRGFNQCYEIAAPFHARLGIKRHPELVQRVLATAHQTGLSRREREHNLVGAFAVPPSASAVLEGQRVMLLDDTMTSGTSLRRLSDCLLAAGAGSLEVAVVAVALPPSHSDSVPHMEYS